MIFEQISKRLLALFLAFVICVVSINDSLKVTTITAAEDIKKMLQEGDKSQREFLKELVGV